jgi:hypothetical protein
VSVAAAVAAAIAGLVYVGYERLGVSGLGLAALRSVAVGALILLLVNPAHSVRTPHVPATVLLDASLSMGAAGGRWREALDTAQALAGRDGVILRFGTRVAQFDTLPPRDGASRLTDALTLARARGGPVTVVTDGAIEDAGTLEPSLLEGTHVVLLPRAPLPDAALLDLAAPARLAPGDSLNLELTIGTFGALRASSANLIISLDQRIVYRGSVTLPPAPGTGRRALSLGSVGSEAGLHLLTAHLASAGDSEPRDDERERWISVAAQPDIVTLAAPADWESRFLGRELSDITPRGAKDFALIQSGRWLDRHTLAPTSSAAVERAATGASVLVLLGSAAERPVRGAAAWRWLGGDSTTAAVEGDWYVDGAAPSSPLAGRLGDVDWDSLPPLVSLVPLVPKADEWVALSARLGRQGAERPVLLGRDSGGVRQLTVTAAGLWRWALRGGAAREAYRSLIAAGVDWLLGSDVAARRAPLAASAAVPAGAPVAFRWTGDSVPDSVPVTLTNAGTTRTATLRFDAQHAAVVTLPPGAYRWTARSVHSAGAFVVERYSSEYPPTPVSLRPRAGGPSRTALVSYARRRFWLFLLVIGALGGEWVWRQRRGLP